MKDLEYIKNRFDEDGVATPESLSADQMRKMLESAPAGGEPADRQEPAGEEPAERNSFKKYRGYIAALAACLVLTLIAVPAVRSATGSGRGGASSSGETDRASGAEDAAVYASIADEIRSAGIGEDEIRTFESQAEVKQLVSKLSGSGLYGWNSSGPGLAFNNEKNVATEELADADSAETAVANSSGAAAGAADPAASGRAEDSGHSDTYRQVEGVDEADIIKTDGKYIYYVDGYGEVQILRASGGRTKKVSTISQFEEDGEITDLYLSGDRLMTVGYVYTDKGMQSVVCAYDITDCSKPEEIGRFKQSGDVLSSRMTGGIIYLVTSDWAHEDHIFPFVTQTDGYKKLPYDDICAFPNPDRSNYVVVSSIDFKTGDKIDSTTKAVLGASGDLYCNTENLYIASTEYRSSTEATRLLKIGLNKGKLSMKASGKVRGYVYGQWAMDEKDGNFRIATTADKNGKDVNNLYVLDEDLKEIGSVSGFARNEHIEAVRFIGDRAYVITYEQIDPLFVLDLSRPTEPKIDGEVEITGFSTLLVPISEDRLIGIGYATEDNGYGGEMSDGLKLALFDVSNPSRPKVLDSKEYANTGSEAQNDHHALLQNAEKGYLAIPYDKWEEYVEEDVIAEGDGETAEAGPEDDGVRGGVLVFTADDEINIKKNYKIKDEGMRRCIYIGDYVYAVDTNDEFTSFKM